MAETNTTATKKTTTNWLSSTLPTTTSINETLNSVLHALIYDPTFNFAFGIGATTTTAHEYHGSTEIKSQTTVDQEFEYSWPTNLQRNSEETENEQNMFNSQTEDRTEQQQYQYQNTTSTDAEHWDFGCEGDKYESKENLFAENELKNNNMFGDNNFTKPHATIVVDKANRVVVNANEKSMRCNYYASADDADEHWLVHRNNHNNTLYSQQQQVDDETYNDVDDDDYEDDDEDVDDDEYYESDTYWDDVDNEINANHIDDDKSMKSNNDAAKSAGDNSFYVDEGNYDGDDEYSTNFNYGEEDDDDDEAYDNGNNVCNGDNFNYNEKNVGDNDEEDNSSIVGDSEIYWQDTHRRHNSSTNNNKYYKNNVDANEKDNNNDDDYDDYDDDEGDEDDDETDDDNDDDENETDEDVNMNDGCEDEDDFDYIEAEDEMMLSSNNQNTSDTERSDNYDDDDDDNDEDIDYGRYNINDFFNESDFELDDDGRAVFKVGQVYDNVEYHDGMTIEEMAKLMQQAAVMSSKTTPTTSGTASPSSKCINSKKSLK